LEKNVFVISVNDDGQERNLVASHVRVEGKHLVVQAGGAIHTFLLSKLMDIIDVAFASHDGVARRLQTGQRLH
jgi:hypothetical protein